MFPGDYIWKGITRGDKPRAEIASLKREIKRKRDNPDRTQGLQVKILSWFLTVKCKNKRTNLWNQHCRKDYVTVAKVFEQIKWEAVHSFQWKDSLMKKKKTKYVMFLKKKNPKNKTQNWPLKCLQLSMSWDTLWVWLFVHTTDWNQINKRPINYLKDYGVKINISLD